MDWRSDSRILNNFVICTGIITLFALVLLFNCTALSQSELSNFFMYVIDINLYLLLQINSDLMFSTSKRFKKTKNSKKK